MFSPSQYEKFAAELESYKDPSWHEVCRDAAGTIRKLIDYIKELEDEKHAAMDVIGEFGIYDEYMAKLCWSDDMDDMLNDEEPSDRDIDEYEYVESEPDNSAANG